MYFFFLLRATAICQCSVSQAVLFNALTLYLSVSLALLSKIHDDDDSDYCDDI